MIITQSIHCLYLEDVESAEGLSIHTVPSHSADPAASDTPPATRTLTSDIEQARPQTSNEEELQLQLALAMSKEEADQQRQEQKNERIRLEMAINESLDEVPSPFSHFLIFVAFRQLTLILVQC